MANLTVTDYTFSTLVAFARKGAAPEEKAELERLITSTLLDNKRRQYILLVRYHQTASTAAEGTLLRIEQERPITRQDVLERLRNKDADLTRTQVTIDPVGQVGWSTYDAFAFGGE